MWYLILLTCVRFDCEHLKVIDEYQTQAECEQAMNQQDLKAGQGLLCIETKPVLIKT